MTKKLLLPVLVITLFAACQKESDNPVSQDDLIGTWNFVSLNAQTQSTSEYDFFGTQEKSISYSDYTSSNNAGTIIFNDSIMSTVGLAYSVSSSVKTYVYENGVLTDSVESPFNFTLPATSSTAKYQLIGSDSIYFPEGGFVSIAGSMTTQSEPSGGRINISSNTLTLTQAINKDTTEVISGVTFHIIEAGKAIISLSKQ